MGKEKYKYLFGKYCDSSEFKEEEDLIPVASFESKNKIMIYVDPSKGYGILSFIQGEFETGNKLEEYFDENPLVSRNEMNAFACKHEGRFVYSKKKIKNNVLEV
jgi:hypothetical protein